MATKNTTTCYRCGKVIKGQAIRTSPPILLLELGIDFPKTFHPACYDKAEQEAARELGVS